MSRLARVLLPLLLPACGGAVGVHGGEAPDLPDPTPDGDADGDGLTDREEALLGTSPEAADSDADGYLDPWEVREGTDPGDPGSRIYQGGWPYFPDKPSLGTGGWKARPRAGERVPRFRAPEHHGDLYDLYDMAGEGPVVVEFAAAWCGICGELDRWLAGEPDAYEDAEYPGVRARVSAGEVRWVTVLVESAEGREATVGDAAAWAAALPGLHAPVTPDPDFVFADWAGVWGYPTLVLLEPDMTIQVYEEDYHSVLVALSGAAP